MGYFFEIKGRYETVSVNLDCVASVSAPTQISPSHLDIGIKLVGGNTVSIEMSDREILGATYRALMQKIRNTKQQLNEG